MQQETIDELKSMGLRVFAPVRGLTTYVHIADSRERIGYIQDGYFGGFDFSSVHKPSPGEGSGYRMAEGGLTPLNVELALRGNPRWANQHQPVARYRDVEAFLKSRKSIKLEEI